MTEENYNKTQKSRQDNLLRRALDIKHNVDTYYQPFSERHSMKGAFRSIIGPQYAISYRTFLRMMKLAFTVEDFIGIGQNMCPVEEGVIILPR